MINILGRFPDFLRDSGSNTLRNHSNPWLFDVQPLLLVEKCQLEGVSCGIQLVLVFWALNMIIGGKAPPAPSIHSNTVIHLEQGKPVPRTSI
jgi:hypothetical protein